MSQLIIIGLCVAVLGMFGREQDRLSVADARAVISEIQAARRIILEDTTSVNYCGVPELFDQFGTLMFGENQKAVRFRSLAECPKVNPGLTRRAHREVEIYSIHVSSDTLTALGKTRKGDASDAQLDEVYLLVRFNKNFLLREYRVLAISMH